MDNAAVYSRVSTEEQKKFGISLEAQLSKCEQYAQAMGFCVIYTGVEGESAKDTDRPELQCILSMVNRRQIQHLIIVKLDRLSRDVEDSARIAKMLTKKGVSLHLVTEGGLVDLSDPSQEMLFTMRSAMGQFERKRISMNTKFALDSKRRKNERISRFAPYGYEFMENKLVESPNEQAIITKILELRTGGASERKIISTLTAEGLYNRQGKPFTRGTIRTVISVAA